MSENFHRGKLEVNRLHTQAHGMKIGSLHISKATLGTSHRKLEVELYNALMQERILAEKLVACQAEIRFSPAPYHKLM